MTVCAGYDYYNTIQLNNDCLCRHPDASSRPQPKDVLRALLRNVDEVMAVPAEDVPEDSQAAVLGAPLHTSTQLYPHLQNTYM